jgi:hypothetical protein
MEEPGRGLAAELPETTLLIHSANPKVGNVRNQDVDLLDSQ